MKVIITGASGMVGEGVLHECLNHPDVESVLVIGRKHCGHEHPKLREIIHSDLFGIFAYVKIPRDINLLNSFRTSSKHSYEIYDLIN